MRWIPKFKAAGALCAALLLIPGCETTEPGLDDVVLQIGPALVECQAVGPTMCLQAREPGQEEWQYFYASIEGFDWEPGYIWTLRLQVREVRNPPADGSSLEYRLIEVIERVAV